MAYARWGPSSDVYVYRHIKGGYACDGCPFGNGGSHVRLSAKRMWEHLVAHHNAGHKVPMAALSSFGIMRHGEDVESDDQVVAEMVAMAKSEGAEVMSWDADVPDWIRGDMSQLEQALKESFDEEGGLQVTEEMAGELAHKLGEEVGQWLRTPSGADDGTRRRAGADPRAGEGDQAGQPDRPPADQDLGRQEEG